MGTAWFPWLQTCAVLKIRGHLTTCTFNTFAPSRSLIGWSLPELALSLNRFPTGWKSDWSLRLTGDMLARLSNRWRVHTLIKKSKTHKNLKIGLKMFNCALPSKWLLYSPHCCYKHKSTQQKAASHLWCSAGQTQTVNKVVVKVCSIAVFFRNVFNCHIIRYTLLKLIQSDTIIMCQTCSLPLVDISGQNMRNTFLS